MANDAGLLGLGAGILAAGAATAIGVTGMAISGSCISAHLYRLGEGSPTAPFALAGTAVGFAAGFWSWNPLYLATVSAAPVVWLPPEALPPVPPLPASDSTRTPTNSPTARPKVAIEPAWAAPPASAARR